MKDKSGFSALSKAMWDRSRAEGIVRKEEKLKAVTESICSHITHWKSIRHAMDCMEEEDKAPFIKGISDAIEKFCDDNDFRLTQ